MGAGALGYHHVRILRDLPGARFIGFHDVRPERADLVSKELGVRAFGDVAALVDECEALTSKQIDCALTATDIVASTECSAAR